MLTKIFKVLHLSNHDERLYRKALDLGPQPVSVLAQKTGLKRGFTYNHLDAMRKRGIFEAVRKNGVKHFEACSPERLISFVRDQEVSIQEARVQLNSALPTLISQPDDFKDSEVVFYNGKAGAIKLLDRSLQCEEKCIRLYGSNLNVANVTSRSHDENHYIPARVKRGVSLRRMIPQNAYGRELLKTDKSEFRETKFLSGDDVPGATLLMYDDEMAILVNKEPFLGILLRNEEVVRMFKGWFDMLWERLASGL